MLFYYKKSIFLMRTDSRQLDDSPDRYFVKHEVLHEGQSSWPNRSNST